MSHVQNGCIYMYMSYHLNMGKCYILLESVSNGICICCEHISLFSAFCFTCVNVQVYIISVCKFCFFVLCISERESESITGFKFSVNHTGSFQENNKIKERVC